MFYYPTVLKHRTGCFSTIWLAATKGIRLPRREFLKVNVKSTCDDIMNYVLERVPPPQPGVPRPRFSLYLSSQLQYGVIVVYHRQCAILLEELHTVVGQLVKQKTTKIDLDDHSRQAQVLPEALSLLEETEGAQDPFFGVISMESMQMFRREPSPEHPEITSPPAAPAKESAITASPDTITLREVGLVFIPSAEFEGVELIDQHPDTIHFLMAETDHFPQDDAETVRGVVERERGEEDLERERTKPFTPSSPELPPPTLPSDDGLLLPQEEPGLSEERPELPPDQLTPVSVPDLPAPLSADRVRRRPSPELQAVLPPEVRRRRKRQLIFFDPETQLPDEEMQQQINNPQTWTRQIPVLPAPSRRIPSAAELFNNPCTLLLEDVLSLWKQAAVITLLSGSDLQVGERGRESTDSDKEREQEMIQVTEREAGREEVTLKADPRDLAESQLFDISGLGTLMLEVSDPREISREVSPMYTSEKEGSTVSRSVSTLQDIPEAVDKIPERPADGLAGLFQDEHDEGPVSFHSLLPPEVDRRTVSVTFQRLLEITSARQVHVEQSEPYGDILIFPGAERLTL